MTDVDYKELSFYLHIIELVCIVGVAIYTWNINRHKVSEKAIKDLDSRVAKLEQKVELMPNHDDIVKINRRISEVAQGLTKIEGAMTQIDNSLQLIHSHLLNN